MADDLTKTLDAAASKMLEKALAGDNFQDQLEAFKAVAAWIERRAKLQPVQAPKGGEKFGQLREKLNGTAVNGKTRGRGTSAKDQGDTEGGDTAFNA